MAATRKQQTPATACSEKPRGRPKGSRYPERITDQWVRDLAAAVEGKTDLQLSQALSVIAEARSKLLGTDADVDPDVRMKARIIKALLRIQAQLAATGGRLHQTAQYTQLKAAEDPALTTIYRHFHSLDEALGAAALAGVAADGRVASQGWTRQRHARL